MNYKTKALEKSRVRFTITLDKTEWTAAIQEAYNKNKHKFSVQGFRKGKVPMKVIENLYGKGVFYEDAINIAFPKYYMQVLDKKPDIFPVGSPELDIDKLSEDGVTLVAIVPVKPEVKLGDYKSIKLEKIEYTVEDEEIQNELDRKLDSAGRMVDVTDRACANGDTVIIDYAGFNGDVQFPGGTAEKQTLVLGSGTFIPGFEDQVVGMAIGEERDINVTFPEQYHEPSLAGAPVVFKIKLHEIKTKELPELNDDFAKDVSEFDTLEEYKADIAKKIAERNAERAEIDMENKIIEKICEISEVEIPDAMIESQIDSTIRDLEYRLMYQGLKLEDYLKMTNSTMEEFRKGYVPDATNQVKGQLVIDKIITDEKIEATEEEIVARIAELAEHSKKPAEEYTKNITDSQRDYISKNIIIKKLFAYLKSVCIAD